MIRKVLIPLIFISLSLQAGEFVKYDRAFRITPGFAGYLEKPGVSLALNYEQRLGKTHWEFGITPKFYAYRHENSYSTKVFHLNDSMSISSKYHDKEFKEFNLEAFILFSHRAAYISKKGNGAFTLNLWRYGACIEWQVYGTRTHLIDGYEFKETQRNISGDRSFGVIYKPTVGVQVNKMLNISLELNYSFNKNFQYPGPDLKYGGGISFIISDPIK